MARLLGVARSGFSASRRRSSLASVRAVVRAELDAKVRRAHADSTGIYGAPRVRAALDRKGTGVDRKTVAASMRRQGLEGASPRRFRPVAPIGQVRVHSIPELVARKWDTGALDAVWISDITYLRTDEGWVYLCAVRDACSRRVIGWAMDSAQTSALVERALRMAYSLGGGGPAGVVFHADRGTQYPTQLDSGGPWKYNSKEVPFIIGSDPAWRHRSDQPAPRSSGSIQISYAPVLPNSLGPAAPHASSQSTFKVVRNGIHSFTVDCGYPQAKAYVLADQSPITLQD